MYLRCAGYQCRVIVHIDTTPCTILDYPVWSNCLFSSYNRLEYRTALVASLHVTEAVMIAAMALLYWPQQLHLFGCHRPNQKSEVILLLTRTQFLLMSFLFQVKLSHNWWPLLAAPISKAIKNQHHWKNKINKIISWGKLSPKYFISFFFVKYFDNIICLPERMSHVAFVQKFHVHFYKHFQVKPYWVLRTFRMWQT